MTTPLPVDLRALSGAKGDGTTDDYAVLQEAIDVSIASGILSFKLPAGNYLISKGLVLGNTDGSFLVGASLTGDGSSYDETPSQTTITCKTGNDFAINLQRVKGFRLSNILFMGQNTDLNNYSVWDVLQNPARTFVGPGVRDNQYSPHCGIGVDLFGDPREVALANRYAAFSDQYISSNNGGSSDIEIENCRVRYFVVGMMISPHGLPQNGEIIGITSCWSDNVKVALAIGQSQNRTVMVDKFHCWGAYVIFDTLNYGDGTGCPPFVTGLNAAGAIRYLCFLNTWVSQGLILKDSHIESIWSLGGSPDPTNGLLTIEDSWIAFVGSLSSAIYGQPIEQPHTVYSGGSLKVTNSYLWQYGSQYSLPLCITCPNAIFDKVFFDNIPYNSSTSQFINCQTHTNNFGNDYVIGTGGSPSAMQTYGGPFMGNMKCFYGNGKIRRRVNGPENGFTGVVLVNFSQVFTVTASDNNLLQSTLNLPASSVDYKNVLVKDVIYYQTKDEYGRNIVSMLGTVLSKDDTTGNIVIGGRFVPLGQYAGGIYCTQSLIGVLILGNTTLGSNTMTGVVQENNANFSLVGTPVYIPQFPLGTTITGFKGNTITFSQPALYTDTKVAVLSADWTSEEVGIPNFTDPKQWGYKRGDIIRNNRFDKYPTVAYWICTRSGITNTAIPPQFTRNNVQL